MLLRQQTRGLATFQSFDHLTNFMLKWISCDCEGTHDDFNLWDN